ncbi:MAG: FkbM family methyltransferase, partial [Phototrophicaceae bacterium]
MQNLLYRLLKKIHNKIGKITSIMEETEEEKILRQLASLAANEQPSNIKLHQWEIHGHDPNLLISGVNYQFLHGINDFYSETTTPYILDCGANIGFSILRYKHLFPNAKIVAFEPDPNIFKILEKNIKANHLSDVDLVPSAVWIESGELEFMADNVDGGFLTTQSSSSNSHREFTSLRVSSINFRDYLQQPVDFIKMDIEGAEYEVLKHCADLLVNVK